MDLIQPLAAAGLIVFLAWAATRALRKRGAAVGRGAGSATAWRFGRQPDPRTLASEARLALTPHHALHVVRAGDRRFLVSTHPGGLSTIAEWNEARADIAARAAGQGPGAA